MAGGKYSLVGTAIHYGVDDLNDSINEFRVTSIKQGPKPYTVSANGEADALSGYVGIKVEVYVSGKKKGDVDSGIEFIVEK